MSIALLFVLLCQAEPAEWIRDVPNPIAGSGHVAGEPTHMITRVLDTATGRPIPGARFFALDEFDVALARLVTPARVARTDENGWARFALSPWQGNWYFVEAHGFGPIAEWDWVAHTVELRRGVDLEVLLTDPLGHPVAVAQVTYYLGCAYSPGSKSARTDSLGRAVIPDVDLDHGYLVPIGEAIEADDWPIAGTAREGRPFRIVASPGCSVEGRVLDAQGGPLAGAYVGPSGRRHGPWARTDEQGRFRVQGLSIRSTVAIYRQPGNSEPLHEFVAPPPGVRRLVRLGLEQDETTLAIRFGVAVEDRPGRDLPLYACRKSDGLLVEGKVYSVGEAEIDLPAGEYELVVGSALGPYELVKRTIRMPDAGGKTLDIPLRLLREMEVDASGVGEDWRVLLATRDEERDVTRSVLDGYLHVPREIDVALYMKSRFGGLAGPVVSIPKSGSRLTIPALPQLEAAGLPKGGAFGAVTVLTHDGKPIPGVSVHCTKQNSFCVGLSNAEGVAEVGYEGAIARVVPGEDWATARKRLVGKGPWTVRFGPSALEVAVLGATRWFCCAPDGELYELDEGPLILRGLPAGPHEFLVAPAAGQAKQCRVVLKPGEHRRVTLRLTQ